MVGTLASYQCSPSSNLGIEAICGLRVLSGFPLCSKTLTSNFQFYLERTDSLNEFLRTPKGFVGKQMGMWMTFPKFIALPYNSVLSDGLS